MTPDPSYTVCDVLYIIEIFLSFWFVQFDGVNLMHVPAKDMCAYGCALLDVLLTKRGAGTLSSSPDTKEF